MSIPDHYLSVYFMFGLVVVVAYAWRQFDEPTFPNRDSMPSTVDPLRHMFTQRAYQKARLTYLSAFLLFYIALVWPGPSMMKLITDSGGSDLPAEAWCLLVALVLVGLVPNSKIKWLTVVEEFLRRSVHLWFLVPTRVEETVGRLEDNRYEPPTRIFGALPSPLREKVDALREDLKAPAASLEHRWARATFIFNMLKHIGVTAEHPLKSASFRPFSDDFKLIQEKYNALQKEVAAIGPSTRSDQVDDDLKNLINTLLKRMYAYISWGLGGQANNEREIDELLRDIGFRIPQRSSYRPIDVLGPAVALVAGITMVFWLTVNLLQGNSMDSAVIPAIQAALSAFCMYGGAIFIAMNGRSKLIRDKDWQNGSPRNLLKISFKAGLATWLTIALSTAMFAPMDSWASLVGLADWLGSFATANATPIDLEKALKLPVMVMTASPWFFVGGAASVLICARFRGDVLEKNVSRRLIDAVFVAVGLGVSVFFAQLTQSALQSIPSIAVLAFKVGLAGLACGAVLGYFVPTAFRTSLNKPYDRTASKALDDLFRRAEKSQKLPTSAGEWIFKPHIELGGITPAEAVQYRSLANSVYELLEIGSSTRADGEISTTALKPTPLVIQGGRR